MDRESMIRSYLDYVALGDFLYEDEKRKIVRKTTMVTKCGKEVVTQVIKDEIEFS